MKHFGERLRSRTLALLTLAAFLGSLHCASMMTNLAKTLNHAIGGALTSKTDDLKDATVEVRFIRNLYPKSLNITGQDDSVFGDLWKDGGNLVSIHFAKELGVDGIMMVTVDLAMPWGMVGLQPRVTIETLGPSSTYEIPHSSYGNARIEAAAFDLAKLAKRSDGPPPAGGAAVMLMSKASAQLMALGQALSVHYERYVVGPDALDQCVQKDAILAAFAEAIDKVQKAEVADGYPAVWSVQ